jgi:hypothetical protein
MKHLKKYNESSDQDIVNYIIGILDDMLELRYVPYEDDLDGNPSKEIDPDSKERAAIAIAKMIRQKES